MKKFENKVAIVTGSSQGIGKMLAFQLAKAGAKVVINSENAEQLEAAFQELKKEQLDILPVVADITKTDHCEKLIQETVGHYGQLDILINNAGITMETCVEEAHPEAFKKVIEVNLLGTNACTHYAIPHIKKTKGNILFISSIAAIHGIPTATAYCSSKKALTAYAEALKTELHGTGVHIGIVYLGFIENDPQKKMLSESGDYIPLTVRDSMKRQSREDVSLQILKVLETRRYKTIFSTLGKLNSLIYKIAPSIIEWILRRNHQKQIAER